MKKKKQNSLGQAVLASSLFLVPFAHATTISGPQGPQQTNGAALFEILGGAAPTAGQIKSVNATALLVNSSNVTIQLDANNIPYGAKAIDGTGSGDAILIPNGNSNIIFNIAQGSGVTSEGQIGFHLANTDTTINNSGTIQANFNAIDVDGTSKNVIVNNMVGGLIQNYGVAIGSTIDLDPNGGGNGFIINNSGSILQSTAGQHVIFGDVNSTFSAINNNAFGIISQTGGAGNNAATIYITSQAGTSGSITNNQNATISGSGSGNAIYLAGNGTTGNLINQGLISSVSGDTIVLAAGFNEINNTGTITSNTTNKATIFVSNAGVILPGGITNSGTISNNNLVGPTQFAIDLGTNHAHATLTQNDGTIFGNVKLAAFDSLGGNNVFIMNGGTITGTVIGDNKGSNILALNSGTLQNLVLGSLGDTVNIKGTDVLGVIQATGGSNIYNFTGGSFNTIQGNGQNDILNINHALANFTINNVGSINFNSPGDIFTLTNPITGIANNPASGLTIFNQTTLIPNANISGSGNITINSGGLLHVKSSPTIDLTAGPGSLINNGNLTLDNQATLFIKSGANAFTSNGTLTVSINGNNNTITGGQIKVTSTADNSVSLSNNSKIVPLITGFIPPVFTYDVITDVNGNSISDNSSLVSTSTPTVKILKRLTGINNSILQLYAQRTPYSGLSLTSVTEDLTEFLDQISQGNGPSNPALRNLLMNLDNISDRTELDLAFQSILPPFNYGLVSGSYLMMNDVFEGIKLRIEDLRTYYAGVSYGDPVGRFSAWVIPVGGIINQDERHDLSGYQAKGGGLILGGDYKLNECAIIGLAGSYSRVLVDDKNPNPKDLTVHSWQGTIYSWLEFTDGFHLDLTAGISSNDYHLKHITRFNQIFNATTADFDGTQFGAQADLGWNLINDEAYYFTPFAKVKYIHLALDDYTEKGAQDLSLEVHQNDIDLLQAGLGVRIGGKYQKDGMFYVPEVSGFLGLDVINDGEQTLAQFIGADAAFSTQGIKPGRLAFDLGLGLNMHVQAQLLAIKYNLELRDEYVGNSLALQYTYFWS